MASPDELAALAESLGVKRPRQAIAWQPAPAAAPADVQVFRLWPEHEAALNLYYAVRTQWRVGVSGPTGLDYAGVRAAPAFRRLGPRREQVFEDLCAIERGWLEEHARQLQQARQPAPLPPGD